jgi:hypothetical protein
MRKAKLDAHSFIIRKVDRLEFEPMTSARFSQVAPPDLNGKLRKEKHNNTIQLPPPQVFFFVDII